jgi:coenzyme F420-reducing hydrogenase delta subunit
MKNNELLPIHESAPQDIFLCGYPRSGHTWFQYLIAGVAYGVDPEIANDSLVQDLVPDVAYKSHYKRYGPVAFFKSHALPNVKYRRVVYLLRHGCDVMVSYHHFLTALKGHVDFLGLVKGKGLSPCHWHEHVERWQANPHNAEILIVRYEDLKTDTIRELRRFCAFAGLSRDDALLRHVVAKAEFGKAQARERQLGWDNKAWPQEHAFIRRGEIGSFRDEMPDEVRVAFLQKAEPTLRRCRYAI